MTRPSLQELTERLDRLPLSGATVLVDVCRGEGTESAAASEVVGVLRTLVGNDGTLIMPAFTSERTLSEATAQPAAFHSDLEVDSALGPVPEVFRRHAAVLRSSHPTNSFTASGPRAQMLLSTNRDNNPLGPVKKINLLNGFSLRIGGRPTPSPVDCAPPTPLHLAELQSLRGLRYRGTAKRLNIAGFEERVVIEHIATCTVGFGAVDEGLTAAGYGIQGGVSLVPLRDLVRAATAVISSAPEQLLCGRADCASCTHRRAAIAAAGDS